MLISISKKQFPAEWWLKLNDKQQKTYITKYPKSKYADHYNNSKGNKAGGATPPANSKKPAVLKRKPNARISLGNPSPNPFRNTGNAPIGGPNPNPSPVPPANPAPPAASGTPTPPANPVPPSNTPTPANTTLRRVSEVGKQVASVAKRAAQGVASIVGTATPAIRNSITTHFGGALGSYTRTMRDVANSIRYRNGGGPEPANNNQGGNQNTQGGAQLSLDNDGNLTSEEIEQRAVRRKTAVLITAAILLMAAGPLGIGVQVLVGTTATTLGTLYCEWLDRQENRRHAGSGSGKSKKGGNTAPRTTPPTPTVNPLTGERINNEYYVDPEDQRFEYYTTTAGRTYRKRRVQDHSRNPDERLLAQHNYVFEPITNNTYKKVARTTSHASTYAYVTLANNDSDINDEDVANDLDTIIEDFKQFMQSPEAISVLTKAVVESDD